ncbi:hypothetical protein BGZ63DRAFT_365330, partial [Mariannaea sp. PMI_226]
MSQQVIGLEASSRVKLQGPGNWKLWINIVKKFAVAHNIWDLVDPSKANKPTNEMPIEPTYKAVNPEAADIAALTTEEFRRLEFLHSSYRSHKETYRDREKALASLQQHIVNTIGDYYNDIADVDDVASELATLRARLEPSDYNNEQRVLEQYQELLKGPIRKDLRNWITSWRKTLTEMKNLNLPEAQDLRPTHRFLHTIRPINPSFANYWANHINMLAMTKTKEQLLADIPDGYGISELFEKTIIIQQTNKGAFSTFQ